MRMKADLSKFSNMMIVTGMLEMIEKEGLTFHQMVEVVEDLKNQCFPALMQISNERK